MPIMDDLALSGHAFYVGEHVAGLRACERVLSSLASDEDEAKARRNRTWYTPTLADLLGHHNVEWSRIDVPPARPGWSLFNPTVAAEDGDTLLCIVRSSNYVIADGRYITPPGDNGRIRTRNLLVRIRTRPKIEEISSMEILGPDYPESEFPIEGLEDLRLFMHGGKWKVSGTVCNVLGADCTRRIATATLLPDVGILCDFTLMPEVVQGRNEKNWMPICGPGDEWVYSCWEDGQTTAVRSDGSISCGGPPAPLIARGFRGGSQLVEPPTDEYIACVHEVATLKDGKRVYEHRFVAFEENINGLRISGISDPFVFQEKRSIEFCAGAAMVSRWGGRPSLALSYGVRDAEAWIAFVDPWAVKTIMRRV
jgi:hypothetical protein